MKSLLKRALRPLVLKIEGRITRLLEAAVRPVVSRRARARDPSRNRRHQGGGARQL